MATALLYRIGQSASREVLDFRGLDTQYTLNGVRHTYQTTGEVVVSGNGLPNVVWATPGVALDARQLLGSTDVILFGGTWGEYTKTLNAVEGTITFTREVEGKVESVTVANGTISLTQDRLVFADGSVRTDTVRKALINHGLSATVAQLTAEGAKTTTVADNWDAAVTSRAPGALLPDAPGGHVWGIAKAPGVSFALPSMGDKHVLTGSGGVDQVYVTSGATVDARQLLGGEDRIFFTGAWADYSKTLDSSAGTITFTREINGKSEHVTVANGQISVARDLLVFADGAVRTDTARLTLSSKGLGATVAELKAQGALTSTTTADDWKHDTFTSGVVGVTIDPVRGGGPAEYQADDRVNIHDKVYGPVTVSGHAPVGSTVALEWGDVHKSVTADAQGQWLARFYPSELPIDGNYKIKASAHDGAGHVWVSSRSVVVDTVAPGRTELDAVTGDNAISAAEREAGVVISGHAEARAKVYVYIDGPLLEVVSADAGGKWTLQLSSSDIPERDFVLSAQQADEAGNFSNVFTDRSITVDTTDLAMPASDTMAHMVIGA